MYYLSVIYKVKFEKLKAIKILHNFQKKNNISEFE